MHPIAVQIRSHTSTLAGPFADRKLRVREALQSVTMTRARAARPETPLQPENDPTRQTSPDPLEEGKLIRRMQMMMNMVMQVIAQDGSLTIDEASQMVADSRKAALAMFPDKELAYELIWRPRFQRLMRERFRIM